MSTDQQILLPPLPSLEGWVENHLISIYKAKTRDEFDVAFDAFITKHNPHDKREPVSIFVNGEKMTREEYKKALLSQRELEKDVVLEFDGVVKVTTPEKGNKGESGLVGLFYKALVFKNPDIRDGPIDHTIVSSLNVLVEPDDDLILPEVGIPDFRRAIRLNQVFASQPGGSIKSAKSA